MIVLLVEVGQIRFLDRQLPMSARLPQFDSFDIRDLGWRHEKDVAVASGHKLLLFRLNLDERCCLLRHKFCLNLSLNERKLSFVES